jgi:phosphoribosylformimino-5-aminoimidazole carboxamide ribotide isomerase
VVRSKSNMQIIPVIDLKQGVVVRARMGQRDQYRPIETPLSPTSDPTDVARGLSALSRFATFYIADLDAIEGRGDNRAAIARLAAEFPDVTFWVDNGMADPDRAAAWLEADLGHLVLGSESQSDAALLRRLAASDRVVLSLDFRGSDFVGPPVLLSDPSLWPHRIIVMTLARVGSGAGPDLARLAAIRAAAPGRDIYAAGGVRDAGDLDALAAAGISGVLVASSLHDGRLGRADLKRFSGRDGIVPTPRARAAR